jgi:hypothetical protein
MNEEIKEEDISISRSGQVWIKTSWGNVPYMSSWKWPEVEKVIKKHYENK